MINHFSVLGVRANAKEDDIKKAYKRLSNKYHPDKLLGASDDEKQQASVQLQRVKKAYEVLSDKKQRNAFINDFNNVIVTDPTAAMRELWDEYYSEYPMAKHLNISRINELKNNANDNIESYNDPDTPNALAKFTSQIREILLADPGMLDSVPEYLPVALYERVKFSPESKRQWAHWISLNIHPSWDEFKTTIAFNNADLPLALAVRKYNEDLLIESCAVVYLLETQGDTAPKPEEDDSDGLHEHERDENDDDDTDYDSDEEGYYDQYDEDIE